MSDDNTETVSTKVCTTCKKKLPASPEYFNIHRAAKNGFSPECRDCAHERWAKRRYNSKTAKSRKAVGLCIECGNVPPDAGRLVCDGCAGTVRHAHPGQNATAYRRSAGLCVKCGRKPSVSGFSACAECLAAIRTEEREVRNVRLASLDLACPRCKSGIRAEGELACEACKQKKREYQNSARAKRIAAGLCPKCGVNPPRKGAKSCNECQQATQEYYRRRRDEVFAGYGNRCRCCGLDDPRFLTIDHVDNDGWMDRAIGLEGNRMFSYILEAGFPPKYQLLCWNCNGGKKVHGECPHVSDRRAGLG